MSLLRTVKYLQLKGDGAPQKFPLCHECRASGGSRGKFSAGQGTAAKRSTSRKASFQGYQPNESLEENGQNVGYQNPTLP